MDVEGLVEQLSLGERLPGVALLVAREVIESAVILGSLDAGSAASLSAAGDHLRQVREHRGLADQLVDIGATGQLPEAERLGLIRNTLRDLVRAVPAEGSVPADVEYAGF